MAMPRLRDLHLYLGCLFAPALIFFAVTGAWQVYRFNDSAKDHSYIAPAPIRFLSAIHTNQHLPGAGPTRYTPLHSFAVLAAIGLAVTTVLGVVMAFRFGRSQLAALLCLLAGVGIPSVILFLYH
jgi:ABC-type nitrate/sulfonate/bicarbonate transport system permease component